MTNANSAIELQPYRRWNGRPSRKHLQTIEMDLQAYEHVPTFPSRSPARTTFYGLGRRLWRLQHARGHTWDGRGKTTARNDYTARRCKAILQQCEVPKWVQSAAVSRVFHENLNGFSRHYAGADGACIGFALLVLYDEPENARRCYIVDRVPSVVPGLEADDVEGLIDYVFRTYGGEE